MDQVLAALVCAVLIAFMTVAGWRDLRRHGATRRGFGAFSVGQAGAIMLCALGTSSLSLWAALAGVALSFALSVLPRTVIRMTGGPTPEYGLRLALRDLDGFTDRDPPRPANGADRTWLDDHLAGLERWRTPGTSQFIDLWIKATRDYWFASDVDRATYEREVAQLWRAAESVWDGRTTA